VADFACYDKCDRLVLDTLPNRRITEKTSHALTNLAVDPVSSCFNPVAKTVPFDSVWHFPRLKLLFLRDACRLDRPDLKSESVPATVVKLGEEQPITASRQKSTVAVDRSHFRLADNQIQFIS
jgi:hypothetical protein